MHSEFNVVPTICVYLYPFSNIYRTQDIKYDENEDFPGVKLKMLKFVGRHMTSQLFDQIINLFSWDDSWFNEALALYLSYYISSEVVYYTYASSKTQIPILN